MTTGGSNEVQPEVESIERSFSNLEVPPWTKQITFRSVFTSAVLSIVFNVIVCKLNLTTGIIPSLNVAAGLLGFAIVKSYTAVIGQLGLLKQPFTRQENTVIQTCIVASSGIAFSSGTASYLLGMSGKIAKAADLGNTAMNVKKLDLKWIYPFLALVSFVGLFSIVPLRKVMILKYKLTYPSGTATAYLINSFHTPRGARLAKKQVAKLFNWFCFSFLFAGFQWFFTGASGDCGFASFPTFGFKAYNQKFYFDFSSTYVGVGMICPYMVNISMLLGAVLSWGVMWPLIAKKAGDWYSADLSPGSLHGLQGYRVFLAVATMLGDGLYHVVYMLIVTIISWLIKSKEKDSTVNPNEDDSFAVAKIRNYDENRRNEYFLKDQIHDTYAIAGYVFLAVLCMVVAPFLFQQRLKWYQVGAAYLIAPVLAFCNAYGCGLTDWSLASNYGKIAILAVSAWVGFDDGGVIAGLAACGVMMSIVSTASDLMQDFKTGYLTLASPRSMFFSQVIGTAMGVLMSPAVFWFFNTAYSVGDPDGRYPAPFAAIYRGIALLGVEGVSTLPKHCLNLAVICFCTAVSLNIVAEILKHIEKTYKIYRFIPSPMCMAIPFYLGGYFTIDMCVGSLILFAWEWRNRQKATEFAPAVASGLICGESLWSVPASILALANVNPPICMKFVPGTS